MFNRVNRVLVTNVTGANTGTSIATAVAGDILVLNAGMNNLTGTPTITSAADNDTIYIAQGLSNGQVTLSSPISLKNVIRARRAAYVAPAEQVTDIGYNGTSGSIATPTNQTEYTMRLVYLDDQRWQPQRQTRGVYNYITSNSATITEVAFAFQRKVNGDPSAKVSATVLTNGTPTAIGASATLAVTNGSPYVTASAAGHNLVVGDIVKIGGNTTTTGAYLVTAVNGVNITLNTPYQGATAAAATGFEMSVITATGLRLTGEAITYNGIDLYMKVSFTVSLVGEGLVPETVVNTTTMNYGNGYWEQIRDLEYFAQGYKGASNRTLFPVFNFPFYYVEGNTYNLFVIEHNSVSAIDLDDSRTNPLTTVIAYYSSSAPTASTKEAAVNAILESLLESAGVFVN